MNTTSAVAAAYWYPYKVSLNPRIAVWAEETYAEYKTQIAQSVPGLSLVQLRELFRNTPPEPWWRQIVEDFRQLAADELPSEYSSAYDYVVPLADTPIYLPWLVTQVESRHIPIHTRDIRSFSELDKKYDLIVNCSGVWAGRLTGDERIFPISGQLQIVSPVEPSGPRILISCDGPDVTYIVHRSLDCVLGGTVNEGDWNRTPDKGIADAIRERCEMLEPQLKNANTKADVVGLRPGRDEVRFEVQEGADGGVPVLHNYGHGGAGYTLCWGCAAAVVSLTVSIVGRP